MKKTKHLMVRVTARLEADLVKLSSDNSPMTISCGAIGRIIAQKVLDGNGQALVPISHIRMAIDSKSGVNALLDNFDLTDLRTRSPLLHALLMDYERNNVP